MSNSTSDDTSHISKFPLFQNLAVPTIKMIEKILVKRDFSRGESIFSEGTESKGFYIIIKGRVKVYKLSAEGKEQIVGGAAGRHFAGDQRPLLEVMGISHAYHAPRSLPPAGVVQQPVEVGLAG